ncbi:MAG: hypothetical protein IJN79_07200 [Clostridia bacterium]|nr:hypothetical protein [Clostridia bacterium]
MRMTPAERKRRADRILYELGLYDRLKEIGRPHVIGSYRMDMMAWNDPDLDIENRDMSKEKLHDLTAYILRTFSPCWYEAKEEINDEGKTVWFHGFEAVVDGELWNFDLWFFDEETIQKAEAYCDRTAARAEAMPGSREAIMRIKEELIARDLYGYGKYASMDVYRAVLDQGIRTAEDLLKQDIRQGSRI